MKRGSGLADCVIIGGGPAGLTAAIYLSRFHLTVTVIDDGRSRALSIPVTHNHSGFPEGISGANLVERMRIQARKFGAEIRGGTVEAASVHGGHFLARGDDFELLGRTLLFATGVRNRRPKMTAEQHDEALARGLLRYCPICDGFEVTDRRLAVIGQGKTGLAEALFLRSFTSDVTLIPSERRSALTPVQIADVKRAGITLLREPYRGIRLEEDLVHVVLSSGERSFAAVYAALGSDPRSRLATEIGVEVTDYGCMRVDAHQRTTVRGVYAAGDVVAGLDQISSAMGQASVAATAIRNDLAEQRPLRR